MSSNSQDVIWIDGREVSISNSFLSGFVPEYVIPEQQAVKFKLCQDLSSEVRIFCDPITRPDLFERKCILEIESLQSFAFSPDDHLRIIFWMKRIKFGVGLAERR